MSAKIEHIFTCTMSILKESGEQGLSMRKIAEKAEMRLSNLQYYFKTKELLLSALLGSFLQEYSQSMLAIEFEEHHDPEQRLQKILLFILTDLEKGECAVIFKEIWAIAERNSTVKVALDNYYQDFYQMLASILKNIAPKNVQQQKIDQAVSMLLPFIEGYCLTHKSLPVASPILAQQFAVMICHLLNN